MQEFKKNQVRNYFKKKHNIKRLSFKKFEELIDIDLKEKGFWYFGEYAYQNYDLHVCKLDERGQTTSEHTHHKSIDNLLECYYAELDL